MTAVLLFASCNNKEVSYNSDTASEEQTVYKYTNELNMIDDKYRTFYEVFVYSFCDSNDDGIGDINGVTSKLDYIQDMGFSGIWLMPINPSTTYHKYDVKDYYEIDSQYGTVDDFKRLISECEKRDIHIIMDLVLNHTSIKHQWFQNALKSLAVEPCGEEICNNESLCRQHNKYCDYYNFVEGKPASGEYYATGVGDWFYEGKFWSEMPDLNLDNENLRKEIEDIAKYWLDMGVSGFRLDAAKEYFSGNIEKNTEILKWFNDYCKSVKSDVYNVGEVWENFTVMSKYYQSGVDSLFNFAFSQQTGKITSTINSSGYDNSAKAFGEAMQAVQETLVRNNKNYIDAPFFTNHDTARASGYFSQDSAKIKMAGAMNLLMSGNVFVYYGEEIGMSGSGKDENKRAPMLWSDADNAGITSPPPAMETTISSFSGVIQQQADPDSILNFYKRVIRLRNENPEIARGTVTHLNNISADNDICFVKKTYGDSNIVICYNISAETKTVQVKANEWGFSQIRGYASSDNSEVVYENDTLTLPPYSVVILK